MSAPRLIRLASRGDYHAIVDDDIFPYINHLRWYFKKATPRHQKNTAYRITSVYPEPQKTIALHQEVVRFHGLAWLEVGHANKNGLDNRLENLVPHFSIAELERRARAIREYQKMKAIRDLWGKNDKD